MGTTGTVLGGCVFGRSGPRKGYHRHGPGTHGNDGEVAHNFSHVSLVFLFRFV